MFGKQTLADPPNSLQRAMQLCKELQEDPEWRTCKQDVELLANGRLVSNKSVFQQPGKVLDAREG